MAKLREQAEVVRIEITKRPVPVFEEIWVISDVDVGRSIDDIDYDEFMEALSLLSMEG